MSRTLNDQPWWVRATKWEQVHYCRDWHHQTPWYGVTIDDCNISEPDLNAWKNWHNKHWTQRRGQCMWEPKYPGDRRYAMPAAPKWYRDHIWNNPVRTREREYARRALKEYRANGDVEEVLPPEQHRHRAGWYYW